MLLRCMGGDETLRDRTRWSSGGLLQGVESRRSAARVDAESRSILLPSKCDVGKQADRLKRMVRPAFIADKLAFLECKVREAVADPVLAQLLSPSAVEGVVASLQKRKRGWPHGVRGGSAAAVKLAEIHQRGVLGASWPFSGTGGRIHDIYKHKREPVCL